MGNQSTSEDQKYYDWQKYYTLKSLPGAPTLVAQGNIIEGQEYQLTSNQIKIAYQRSNISQPYCSPNRCINRISKRQSQQYMLRKQQAENVVKILNFKFNPSCYDFINDQVNYSIITERIHCRLKDLDGISRKEGLYILYHALKGYNAIANAGKLGYVNSEMIGLTISGDIKVWINSCWAINYPQKPLASQRQDWMIDEVVYTIQEQVRKTCKNGFGEKFASQYSLQKKKFIPILSWLYTVSKYQQSKTSVKNGLKLKILNTHKKLEKKETFDNKILLKAQKIIDLDNKIDNTSQKVDEFKSTGYDTKKTHQNDFFIELHKPKKISVTERKNKTERIASRPVNYRQSSVNQIQRKKSQDHNLKNFQSNQIKVPQILNHQFISSESHQKFPMKICFNFFQPTPILQNKPKIKYVRNFAYQYPKYPLLNSETTVTTSILPNNSMNSFNEKQVQKKRASKNQLLHSANESFISELSLSLQNSNINSQEKMIFQKRQHTPDFDREFRPQTTQIAQQGLRFTFSSDKNINSNIMNHCLSHSASEKDLVEHVPVKQQQPTAQMEEKGATQQYLRDFRYYLDAYHPQESEQQSQNVSHCQEDKSLTVIYESSELDEQHN